MDPSYNMLSHLISIPMNTLANLPYLQHNSVFYFEFSATVNETLLVKQRLVQTTTSKQLSGIGIYYCMKSNTLHDSCMSSPPGYFGLREFGILSLISIFMLFVVTHMICLLSAINGKKWYWHAIHGIVTLNHNKIMYNTGCKMIVFTTNKQLLIILTLVLLSLFVLCIILCVIFGISINGNTYF